MGINSGFKGLSSLRFVFKGFIYRTALFLVIMQRVVVIPYRHFGTTYWSHLQGSRLDSWPLKKGPIGCHETSVRNHHYSLHNSPENRNSHLLRGGSLKPRTSPTYIFISCHTDNPTALPFARPRGLHSNHCLWRQAYHTRNCHMRQS